MAQKVGGRLFTFDTFLSLCISWLRYFQFRVQLSAGSPPPLFRFPASNKSKHRSNKHYFWWISFDFHYYWDFEAFDNPKSNNQSQAREKLNFSFRLFGHCHGSSMFCSVLFGLLRTRRIFNHFKFYAFASILSPNFYHFCGDFKYPKGSNKVLSHNTLLQIVNQRWPHE